MDKKGIEPAGIGLDDTGRVVLSDAELDRACSNETPLAGAGITNGLNCTNSANCDNSLNTAQCTNSAGACSGSSNMRSCGVASR